jgi:tryptophan synthase beta chain
MQDEFGQVLEAESSAPASTIRGSVPEHSFLAATGRARYESVNDDEVIEAFQLLSRTEGIIPPSSLHTRWRGYPARGGRW